MADGPFDTSTLANALWNAFGETRPSLVLRCEDGRVLLANPAACSMLALDATEIAEKTLEDLHVEFELDLIERRRDLAIGKRASGELMLTGGDGESHWLHFDSVAIPPLDGVECRLLVGRDCTHEIANRVESEGKLSAVNRGQALAEYDLEGKLIAANEIFLTLMLGSLDEMLGVGHNEICDPNFAASDEYSEWWEMLCMGEVDEGERCYRNREGREIWLREVYNPIFGVDGRPFKILQAALDVTQAKLSQCKLADSINYSSRIQGAMHARSRQVLEEELPDRHCLIWMPRDIVGGDCFYVRSVAGRLWACLFDCTGHGVPGAFLTSIVVSECDRILALHENLAPGEFLSHLHQRIKVVLNQIHEVRGDNDVDDGLDAVAICLDRAQNLAYIASAELPVFVFVGDAEPRTLKPTKAGVGYRHVAMDTQWSTHILPIEAGMRIFSATDGIYDQVGGEYQVGFGVRRFAKTLHEHGQEPIATQGESTMRDFIAYQGSQHRRDDFAFVGLQAG